MGISETGDECQWNSIYINKGAVARRTASLERKGYLSRSENPEDGRSRLLYATPEAEQLKTAFSATLNKLYLRSKQESRSGFSHVPELFLQKDEGEDHAEK